MIAHITGTIAYKKTGVLVITANGIGYKVYAPYDIWKKSMVNTEISLFTYLVVREDKMDLYGFADSNDLDFFEKLIGVSGIGPKSALSILNLAPVSKLTQAIAHGDSQYLTKVSGIGKKSAAKIILELKDTIVPLGGTLGSEGLRGEQEALEALISLGYTMYEAREALRHVAHKDADTGETIKQALKLLSRS